MSTTVNFERHEKVALLKLSRPEAMNAIDPHMKRDLPAALELAARDPQISAVVLTGAGDRAFCTGSDLKAASASDDRSVRRTARSILYDYQPVIDLITRMDKPVIAAVNGAAVGIGMSMALSCDLMLMSSSAYLMAPFMNIGLIPDGGAAWFLVRKLGYARAFEALSAARKLSAAECLEWGLCNRVVDPAALRDDALNWAQELASRPPIAMALTKRVARQSLVSGLQDMISLEAELQAMCAATEDAREAMTAFAEKRKPEFTGR